MRASRDAISIRMPVKTFDCSMIRPSKKVTRSSVVANCTSAPLSRKLSRNHAEGRRRDARSLQCKILHSPVRTRCGNCTGSDDDDTVVPATTQQIMGTGRAYDEKLAD